MASTCSNEHLQATIVELRGAIRTLQGQLESAVVPLRKLYLSTEEVAQLVGRAPYTVRRWIRAGKLVARNVGGAGTRQRYLIHRDELSLDAQRT